MKFPKLLIVFAGLTLGLPFLRAAIPPAAATPGELMADYGRLLQAGDREGIIALYSGKGALAVDDSTNEMRSPKDIATYYQTQWSPPLALAWDPLGYRVMSPDVVIVSGGFAWTDAKKPGGLHYNYSATLVREGGTWRIRSETMLADAAEVAQMVAQAKVAPVPAEAGGPTAPATAQQQGGAPGQEPTRKETEREKIRNFVRAYEPVRLGLSQDEGDEVFMDFTLSLMLPLLGGYWDTVPDAKASWITRKLHREHLGIFLTGTVRAGQYIWGRPSAPVVEKRFNPQLFLRYWIPAPESHELAAHRYVDLIYGHESNGQSINSLQSFDAQREIYRQLEETPDSPLALDRSFRSARDAISRGWDYAGLEVSWSKGENYFLRVKVREFLPRGLLQTNVEQSNVWEGFGPTRPRRQYDGLTAEYTVFGSPKWKLARWLPKRYTFTYTTGLSRMFENSTYQVEVGGEILGRPLSIWFRSGYNSNLIDYFQRSQSAGAGISIWEF